MKTEAVPPQRTTSRSKKGSIGAAAASSAALSTARASSATAASPDTPLSAPPLGLSWEALTPDIADPRTVADEWLESDGLGGFSSGTRYGVRTRRYHALLLTASIPPSGRLVLINGVEAWVETAQGDVIALTTQAYAPDTLHPDGWRRLRAFSATPWPTWRYALSPTPDAPDESDGVTFEICNAGQGGDVILRWSAQDRTGALAGATLRVRPLLSVRDYHALHKRNDRFDFTPTGQGGRISWRPYADRIAVSVLSNGVYQHDPEWFDRFRYHEETVRGLDDTEDLASPGIFTFAFGDPGDQAMMVLRAGDSRDVRVRDYVHHALLHAQSARAERAARIVDALRSSPGTHSASSENDESTAPGAPLSVLARAVHRYIVERGSGATVIAGYPWFTDWGRDTFIALRGIALSSGNAALAGAILQEWASVVDQGMLPNRFTDDANPDAPAEYNAVDASLWFVVAAHAFLGTPPDIGAQDGQGRAPHPGAGGDAPGNTTDPAPSSAHAAAATVTGSAHPLQPVLHRAMEAIVEGYAAGTRFGIHADADGLLFAGVPESQLTWMDARVGIRPVTPRIGKPVEVQALWINALRIVGTWVPKWRALADQAQASFTRRFVQAAPDGGVESETGAPSGGLFSDVHDRGLHDNVDADGEPGRIDASLRPNQIFAVGGLPYPVVDLPTARAIVAHVERHLWTPMGLRTLAPSDPRYIGRYEGSPDRRDNAYHQGTVWPWLLGPFVEAWLRVHAHGRAPADLDRVAAEARRRFIAPLDAHLASAGIGHISEIADGDAPHTPRGAPFQAWSLAERLRMEGLLRHPASAAAVPFI